MGAELRAAVGGGRVSITSEPSPYRRDSRHSFMRDLLALHDTADPDARDRLMTNNRHVMDVRALSSITTNLGAEFIVPYLFLGDDYAQVRDAGRPFANALGSRPLDPGIPEIRIPKITSGLTADFQTEGSAYSTGDISTDQVLGRVEAIGHYADVSRQAIERSAPGVDEVILTDQLRAVNLRFDSALLNGTGTPPQLLGALNVPGVNVATYTDSTPTQAEWLTAFGKAIATHVTANASATLAVLHPRRWAWLLQATDTTGRPLIEPTAYTAQNQAGSTVAGGSHSGPVGTLAGVPIIVDGNLPTNLGAGTNQDVALILEHTELRLWEAPPRVAIEQGVLRHQGQVRIVTFIDAAAIPHRRPAAITTFGGTGFTPPA
jgi:hypothetical protein